MNSNTMKKIISVLLSIMICVPNCVTQSYAVGTTVGSNFESETEGSDESNTTDIIQEQTYDIENDMDEPEQPNEESTVDNESDALTAPEQIDSAVTLADEDVFASLNELKDFYERSNTGALQNALDFSNYDTKTIGANAVGLILLSCVEKETFEGYTIKLNGLSGGGSNLTTAISGYPYTFHGLGRSDYPFKGTITVSDATQSNYIQVTLDRPFFNSIDVTAANIATIDTIKIITAREAVVAFAQEVSGNDTENSWANVEINIDAYTFTDNEATTITYPGSCIGVIKTGASFSLGKISYNSKAKVNETSGDAGLLCNTIENNASFSVGSVSISNSVSVTSGKSSGGLVGSMATNSFLTVGNAEKLVIDGNWEIKGKDAGAVIGSGKNVKLSLNVEVDGAKVTSGIASGSAGGIIGNYNLSSEAGEGVFQNYSSTDGTIKVKNIILDATADNISCGGLLGILELSKDFEISVLESEAVEIYSTAGLSMSGSNYALKASTSYGGLAGQVLGTDSNGTLSTLKVSGNMTVESGINGDVSYYGGLIGVLGKSGIDDANTNGVYTVINNNVTTSCVNSEKMTAGGHYFGGAVGGMFYDSVLEISQGATFTPTASNIKYGGGIVGVAGRKSTLRLAGTTDLRSVTFAEASLGQNPGSEGNYRNTNGQIVGVQNASIIYAAKSWILNRPSSRGEIDDIGNYGSVIRLGKNIGQGSKNLADKGGLSETLIQQDTETHKTSFGIEAASLSNGIIEIQNTDQFALLSIAEQTWGDFGIYPRVTNGLIIGGNKATKIVLKADIDLSNTGINGLQRDFYNGSNVFTGELDGNNNTITLDVGQLYAIGDQTGAGNGQIHAHPQIGLFSQANATIKNLTIKGTINIWERTLSNNQKTSMAVGAAVALSTGSGSTFENVTTSVVIGCEGTGTESHIGGLIGLKQGTDSSLSMSDCIGSAKIKDKTTSGKHSVGGLIGTYTGGGTITVSGTTLSGYITGNNSIADAKYGGLVSVIKDNAANMHLNNLTVNDQKIENGATTSSGGLLGYEWNNTEVYFGDGNSSWVVVQGESAVTVNGDAEVGGLVYRATGYWQVNDFELNRVNIQNQNGDLGLMICYGRKEYSPNSDVGSQLLYVEETKHDAYHIDANNVTVSSAGGYFDEWVVYTAKDAESIIDNGNSVISIATEEEGGKRKGFDPTDSTSTGYQNKTTNGGVAWQVANPNARYYYDLDDIRKKAETTSGYVDTAGEAVLWSVWRYCEKVPNGKGGIVTSNIQEYLKTADIESETFGGNRVEIDLTGYSYYPVTIDAADATIQDCTIVFANQDIESAENIRVGDRVDSLVRTTSGTATNHTQHYMMHTGLILNYKNTSISVSSATLSVINVTLKGTIGKSTENNGSGAIVCGTVEGTGVGGNHVANVKLSSVTMDNLTVNTDADLSADDCYAPLLINKVGSYGGIDAQQISTQNYNSTKAATSLIGHVGNATATNISIAFSNGIDLSGRTADSIFTHASLLESFQYLSSSSGYYHFNEDETCTYGREIDGTKEYVDIIDGVETSKQLYYFDTRVKIKDGDNTTFNTNDYLPYVYQTKLTDPNKADTFHEFEINIVKPDLDEGCGTYDDPYIISQAEQLTLVAQYIAGIKTAGWKVNIVVDAESIKSEGNVNHTLYVFSGGSWGVPDSSEATTKDETEVRDYLRNAYYKISDNLSLNNFSGLGTMENPFRGVVDGANQEEGNYSVTINAEKVSSGFINVSYGSVVQNLNITYTGTKTLSNTQAALNSNTVANESYFGGIIGDVKGGDNLIRNVSVEYKYVPNADDNFRIIVNNHLQCVGGFFGIVEGGGVILNKMTQPNGLNTTEQIDITNDNKTQAYVSPLVGRVLDGFVINETTETETSEVFESENGLDKNYSIGNISSTASVSMSSGNVQISSAEQLLVLSAIINSGACSAGYSLAYKNVPQSANFVTANSGKVRNADYSYIGKIGSENFSDYFNISRKDDANSPAANNLPYLVTKYAGNNEAFWTLCTSTSSSTATNTFLDLSITDNLYMSVYKNGYRGIGGRYNCTATSNTKKTNSTTENQKDGQFQRNTPVFVGVDGKKHTIKVANQINGYSDDNYVANAAGGLINVLRRKVNTEVTIQNLTVTGNVELHDFSDNPTSSDATNASGRSYAASVGGVIGRYFTEENTQNSTTYLFLTNLKAKNLILYSDGATGGIVGQTGTKNMYIFGNFSNQYASGVTYTDCSYNDLTATSCNATGGIVGAACDNANSYQYGGSNDTSIKNTIVVNTNSLTGYSSTLNVYAKTVSENGLGGLAGSVGSDFEINKEGGNVLVLDKITFQTDSTSVSRTGGAIGFLHHGTTTAYNMTVSNSTLGNGKDDNLGGIVGCWFSSATGGVMENIIISNCQLKADLSVGGVVGYIDKGTKIIRNVTVNKTTISQNSSSSSRGAALVVGQIAGGGIFGENILLKDSTITANTSSKGRIIGAVGNSADLPIQLLGVSIQYGNDREGNLINVSTQPVEDIGSIKYTDYSNKTNKIFIAYDAFQTDKNTGSELAQWPCVSIPGVGLEENNEADTTYKITGDTVNPYTITGSTDTIGIVEKEGDDYKYIGKNKTYQYVDTDSVDRLIPGIVSTYNANQDNPITDDFQVIQIDGSAACLKQYLNAATNGAFATGVMINSRATKESDKIMSVDISRYKWNSANNKFEIDSSAKPTLAYDSADGSFYATAQYDNQNDMFTLVSVTFKTTSNNYTRTYHIPVIVRRMLQVDFMATMVSGTVFNAAEMDGYKTHALASAGEEITGYLTFKYNSNLSGTPATYDWQSYMEGGANLLGYYKKTLDTGTENLPEGTQITLIDCQQSEKRYHTVVPEGGSDLELFNGNKLTYAHSGGSPYQPVSLAELLKVSATKITNDNYSGTKWVLLPDENKSEATVVGTDGNYYRLYDAGKDYSLATTDCFELTVKNSSPEENYFVVITVPKAENYMLTLIKTGGVTEGSMEWSDGQESAPPTEIHQLHRYKDESGSYTAVDTNKSSEITFNFLDNYSQDLADLLQVESIPVTSQGTSSLEMDFDVKNKVEFVPDNYEQSDPLYQELRVSLRKTMDGLGTDLYFPSDAEAIVDLYAYYEKDGQRIYFTVDAHGKLIETSNVNPDNPQVAVSYDWIAGNDGIMTLPFAVKKEDGTYQYVDLSPLRIAAQNERMFYLEAKLQKPITIGINSIIANDILPVRETPESQNQTNLYFTSVLSFKESGLSYSTLRKSASGNKGYYLNEKREAVLKLDYLNVDQIGINLSDEYTGEIDTMLTLDFSGAEGFNTDLSKFTALNDSDSVVFQFSLKQKGQSGLSSEDYGEVLIGDHINSVSITNAQDSSIDGFILEISKESDGTYPYYNTTSGVFSIPLTFKVNTDNVAQYSNYRIYATADLKKEGLIQGSAINEEKAFITYTIAKININGIWSKPAGSE